MTRLVLRWSSCSGLSAASSLRRPRRCAISPPPRPTPTLMRALCSRAQAVVRAARSTAGDVKASSRLDLRVGRAAAISSRSAGLLEAARAASCSVGALCFYVGLLPADVVLSPVHVFEVPVRAWRVLCCRRSPPWRPVPACSARIRAVCALCERRGTGKRDKV